MTQPNIWVCCLESPVLHTWVLGTLCKAYLEHTLPGVESRPVCKVKLQLSISEGQHRLQAGVYGADQPSWEDKGFSQLGVLRSTHTSTHTHRKWEGRDGSEPSRTCLSLQAEQRPSANILPSKSGQLLINRHSYTHWEGSVTLLFLAFVVYRT